MTAIIGTKEKLVGFQRLNVDSFSRKNKTLKVQQQQCWGLK